MQIPIVATEPLCSLIYVIMTAQASWTISLHAYGEPEKRFAAQVRFIQRTTNVVWQNSTATVSAEEVADKKKTGSVALTGITPGLFLCIQQQK